MHDMQSISAVFPELYLANILRKSRKGLSYAHKCTILLSANFIGYENHSVMEMRRKTNVEREKRQTQQINELFVDIEWSFNSVSECNVTTEDR